MKSVAIIPARIGSTRFPRKVLAEIQGKPMIIISASDTQNRKLTFKVFYMKNHKTFVSNIEKNANYSLLS